MQRVAKAALAAREQVGQSVEYSRRSAIDEAYALLIQEPQRPICLFGVKDTDQISREVVQKLEGLPGHVFHTVDTMAPGGRAVDPNLVNPLTGRMMTGSSSASCVNILLGINDLALATDGGGSVMAPAISTGLYSIMAKGLGLKGSRPRVSTDSIQFVPGIGVISHSYELCLQAITHLTGVDMNQAPWPPMVLIRPRNPRLHPVVERVQAVLGTEVRILEDPACPDRYSMIAFLNAEFKRSPLILSIEGPVDLEGYGDSVLGVWGALGQAVQAGGARISSRSPIWWTQRWWGFPSQNLPVGCWSWPRRDEKLAAPPWPWGQCRLFEEYFIQGWTRSWIGYI